MRLLFLSIIIVFVACSITFLNAQESIARGSVFYDENKNSIFDKGEKGIAEVKVSNGLDVVKTDENGNYSITLLPNSILFISKPAAYSIPLNKVNLPQFYYRHYPDGTPEIASWKWPVIRSTGPLPKVINFPLLKGTVSNKFKAMGFADPQTGSDEQLDMLRKDIIDDLFGNPYEARFGMVAGDVVYDNLGLYERHNRLMSQMGIPMWNVPGNHDLNQESPDHDNATATYKSVFGPAYYSFDYGQVHFLALNNVAYKGKGNGYEGYIDTQQLKWIENDLRDVSEDKLIMIISHIPLLTYANPSFPSSINTRNFDELLNILSRFKFVYTISGHDTSNSWKVEINHTHGWHGYPFIAHTLAQTQGGGWYSGPKDNRGVRDASMEDGNPNGYYVFYFEDHKVRPQFIPAGGKPSDRLRIMLDPPLISSDSVLRLDRGFQGDSLFIVVNFFDGGVRDQVSLTLDGGEKVHMEHKERTDPYYEKQFLKYKESSDSYRQPAISSHIWQLLLPKLKSGLHSARVNVKDEFGFEFQKVLTFEILEYK